MGSHRYEARFVKEIIAEEKLESLMPCGLLTKKPQDAGFMRA
jgi:hypothetical protein